ncbi:succinylglutamate desuccinylase [Haloferula helveola]|uniref:Succinylglutamate desuccinylase n=2 Tax=Haloferula helveola TaxID=490095 RepID=A0ABN6H086_9BACT|nr:succinylglutamate desuccinylase [Haloferula helveola]
MIPPGSRQRVSLEVGTFLTSEVLRLDVHVIHGKRPGPCLLLTAAIHGDESNGTEIIRRILRDPRIRRLRGTLLAIPIVNRPGFVTRSRYMPDRRDLNRLFPGTATGSLGGRLARVLVEEVVPRADAVIDLHTGAVNRPNFPQIRICPDAPDDLELARTFGPPVILIGQPRENTFRHTCQQLGKPILLYEAGEALRLDTPAIRFGVQGILAVMRSMEMLSGRGPAPKRHKPLVSRRSFWERAPAGGIFTPLVALGKAVEAGTQLGFVADPHGSGDTPVVASKAGVLIGRTNDAATDEGDGLFHVATLDNLGTAENRIAKSTEMLPSAEDNEDDHPVPYDSLTDTI